MPRSILTEKIARRGRHVFREYGVDPFERHFVDEVMTRSVITIAGSMRAGDVLRNYFGIDQQHRAYPVVQDRKLIGMLDRATLQALSPEVLELPVREFLAGQPVGEYATPGDTCREVALQLAVGALERLPVVDDSASLLLVGIVSRSDLLKPSHWLHGEDVRRERSRPSMNRGHPSVVQGFPRRDRLPGGHTVDGTCSPTGSPTIHMEESDGDTIAVPVRPGGGDRRRRLRPGGRHGRSGYPVRQCGRGGAQAQGEAPGEGAREHPAHHHLRPARLDQRDAGRG